MLKTVEHIDGKVAHYTDGTLELLSFEMLVAYETVYRNIPNPVVLLHEELHTRFRVIRTSIPNKPFALTITR